jgi:hypothetical protein
MMIGIGMPISQARMPFMFNLRFGSDAQTSRSRPGSEALARRRRVHGIVTGVNADLRGRAGQARNGAGKPDVGTDETRAARSGNRRGARYGASRYGAPGSTFGG